MRLSLTASRSTLPAAGALSLGLTGLLALPLPAAAETTSPPPAAAAVGEQVRVCVDVQLKSWRAIGSGTPSDELARLPPPPLASPAAPTEVVPALASAPPGETPPPAPALPPPPKVNGRAAAEADKAKADNPYSVQPEKYVKRMVEYEVTHEVGYEAVATDCRERMTIEMYPLPDGWTVFARYTGTAREEKVPRVAADELAILARRLTRALLDDVPISETIQRATVLRADSEAQLRMIEGRGYWTLALGTTVRAAELPTATTAGQPVGEEWRIQTPLDLQLGYRGKFQAWALDAFFRGMLGMSERAVRHNDLGGHADYSKGMAAGLHFLGYTDPDAMNSLYFGGGASFELSSYDVVKPMNRRGEDDREGLTTGGLSADLVAGCEFGRASAVHFFTQLDLQVPTYYIDTENESGGLSTYAPSAVVQIGLVF